MLCDLCKKVRYPHAHRTKSNTGWRSAHDACIFRHHANFQDLIQSALDGCELCSLFKPFVEYAQGKQSGLDERAESDASSSQGSGWSHDDPFEWNGETEKLADGGCLIHNVPEVRIGLTDGIFYEDEGNRYRWLTSRMDEKYWHYQEHLHEVLAKEEKEDVEAGLIPDSKHQHESDRNEVLQWLLQDPSNCTGPEQIWITGWTFHGDDDFSYMGHKEFTTVLTLSAASVDDRHLEEGNTICLDGNEVYDGSKALAMKLPWLWKWRNNRLWVRQKKPLHNLKPHFEFYQHRDRTAGKIPLVRALDVSKDPTADACFKLVRNWLAKCDDTHQKCSQVLEFEKPTRLIDVGLKECPKKCFLYTTEEWVDLLTEYATLSHCWGVDTSQMLRLQSGNIEQMRREINVSTLSQTFQDAIEITRGLGIRYLWIDALCIIQDSVDDWSKESPRMGQYFRGGKIMISALASPSSQNGILQPRVPALPPVKLTIDGKDVHLRVALDAAVTVQQLDPWNDLRDGLSVTPLRKRGWTLQEGLFAPRIIHYTSQQLVWQCKTCMTSEDNQCRWNCHNPKKRPYAHFMKLEPTSQLPDGKAGPTPDVKGTGWYNMVQAFSNRRLTYLSDILPAVSGLAREVRELTGATYLTGLWKDSSENSDAFIRNLLWTTYHRPHMEGLKDSAPPRRSLNGSPSWSWTSIVGSIEFDQMEGDWYRLHQPNIDPRFLHMQTIPITGNQLGQVDGGRIAVIGTCHVYTGPLTFTAVTTRRKAELSQRAEEKIQRRRKRKLLEESEISKQEEIGVKVHGKDTSNTQGEADHASTSTSGYASAEEDKDSNYSDHNIYLASMEWDTPDNDFDYGAYDATHVEKDYGNHTLKLDVLDPHYDWMSHEHLILFMGRWDAWPITDGLKEESGQQWYLVMRLVENQDAKWEKARPEIQTVYEEPNWRSEFMGEGQRGIPYYERVGYTETEMDYQLPVTEEEGWMRKAFYFV